MAIVTNSTYVGLLVAGLAVAPTGWSDSDAIGRPEAFSAQQLVTSVWQRNPGMAELNAAVDVAINRIEPAGSLDDPTFSYGFAPRTLDSDGHGLNQKFEVSQKLPWAGTLAARKIVAEREAAMAHRDVANLRLRLAATAKSAYAEWYFIHQAQRIHRSTHELLAELGAVARARYAAGKALQQDALQAELEQANLERHLLELRRIETVVLASINSLLNQDPSTPLPAPVELELPILALTLAELQRRALNAHPELERMDHQIYAREAEVTLAERAFYPDFRIMAGYNRLWEDSDKRPIVGVSINLPLDRGKRRADLDGARANVRRAESMRDDRRTQLMGDLARAHAAVVESVDALALYRNTLLPLADDYLEATLADYQTGSGSFLAVTTASQQKLKTEEALERNRADVLRRFAELERWTGAPLDARANAESAESAEGAENAERGDQP